MNLLALALMGCSDQGVTGNNNTGSGPAPASISGRVCDPSGRNWLADALAYTHYFDENGTLIETVQAYSDPDGFWILDDLVPNTEYQVFVQTGDDIVLDEVIYVGEGDEVRLPEPACFDPLESKVAIITGSYDDFRTVLNTMGFANYTLVDGTAPLGSTSLCEGCQTDILTFLTDDALMAEYDIIMFNGGHIEEDIIYDGEYPEQNCANQTAEDIKLSADLSGRQCADVIENLETYVSAGGSIYASDWSYDVVEKVWPDRIEFVGDDLVPDSAQLGSYGAIDAALTDQALAEWLGKTDSPYIAIEYDLPVWPPILSADESVSVHLSGSPEYGEGQSTYQLSNVPLMVSFNSGDGKVVYSTFRVAKNASTDMLLVLQYMMYNL